MTVGIDFDPLTHCRVTLRALLKGHHAEDVVAILAETIDDEAMRHAQRLGDYQRAAELKIVSRYLERLEDFVDNLDPTKE